MRALIEVHPEKEADFCAPEKMKVSVLTYVIHLTILFHLIWKGGTYEFF
jgi:hypothetical protein